MNTQPARTETPTLSQNTRHSLLRPRPADCPTALYCPNTGTDQCDSGTGCPAC
jgi:hypothetical protein